MVSGHNVLLPQLRYSSICVTLLCPRHNNMHALIGTIFYVCCTDRIVNNIGSSGEPSVRTHRAPVIALSNFCVWSKGMCRANTAAEKIVRSTWSCRQSVRCSRVSWQPCKVYAILSKLAFIKYDTSSSPYTRESCLRPAFSRFSCDIAFTVPAGSCS